MTQRRHIVEQANKKGFYLMIKGTRYPARLSGYLLDFPTVSATSHMYGPVSCEISWDLAERLANGLTNLVVW